MKLFIIMLFVVSTNIFAFTPLKVPRELKATLVHNSISESEFSLSVQELGECTTKMQTIQTCVLNNAKASIGTKDFALDKMVFIDQHENSTTHAYLYYFYGKVPFQDGKSLRAVRVAVLFDKDFKVTNGHVNFEELNIVEQMIVGNVEF